MTAAVAALQEAGGAGADQLDSKPHASLASVESESAAMGPIEPQPTPFSALASSSLSEAPATQLSISPKGPEATSITYPPRLSPAGAATDTMSGSLQASRSLSESMVPSEGPPSWASSAKRSATLARPLEPATAQASSPELLAARSRLALERNASVLRGLQQSKAAGIGPAGRQVSSSASIALTQRGNSTQSSVDLYVPDIGASAAAAAASAGPAATDLPAARPAAPLTADKSPSKPPPFPQLLRAGQPSRPAGEGTPRQQEEAVRHWVQYGQQSAPESKVPGPPFFPGAATELAMPAVKAAASAAAAAAALSTQTVAYLDGHAQAGQGSGDAAAPAETALPAQLAANQERQLLAASLPEGLRTALGLSMGQPVGQPQRKGTQVDVQPASADAPASGGEAPGPAAAATATPSLLSQAEAGAAAAALPQLALQAQLAASAAAAPHPLYMPVARGAAQMAMAADQQAGSMPGATEMPALNPLSYQLYQMLMGSLLGSSQALKQPAAQFPEAMAASVAAAASAAGSQARPILPVFGGADGGAAAMAQLMSVRAEAFAVHLCVKLFHCSPADLPEDVREQLVGWLQAAPACIELYIRSGCVHVTVTVSVILLLLVHRQVSVAFFLCCAGLDTMMYMLLKYVIAGRPCLALFSHRFPQMPRECIIAWCRRMWT